jgi:hypothetical protein
MTTEQKKNILTKHLLKSRWDILDNNCLIKGKYHLHFIEIDTEFNEELQVVGRYKLRIRNGELNLYFGEIPDFKTLNKIFELILTD